MEDSKSYFYSNRGLFRLFLPIMVEQGLEYTVGLAASVMVARVGEAAVSGVSLVDFVMALIISIFAALATGGSVIAGQYFGRKEPEHAKAASSQLLKGAFLFSILLTLLLMLVKPFILGTLFGEISPEVKQSAQVYFQYVVLSVPFLALYNCGAAVFRTMGNSRLPMQIMLIMNILNVAGNAILVNVFHMGVAGVAIPTLIARAGAAVIILYMAGKSDMKLSFMGALKTRFDRGLLGKILRIGAPFGFENGMFYLGRIIVLSVVALSGTAAIAANSVGGTIVMFEVLPGMAMNLGLSVVISRCVGAGDYTQADFYKKKVRKMMHGSFVVSTALVIALMPFIMQAYSLSSDAVSMTWFIVVVHGIMMILIWPSGYMLPVVFRGAGDAAVPMIVSIVSMIVFRIALSWVFAVQLHMGMEGTWYAMFVDWIVKSVIFEIYYKKGRWKRFGLTS